MYILINYLNIQDIMKVMAGRVLYIAAANVAVVYFKPREYRFWSITGLFIDKKKKTML